MRPIVERLRQRKIVQWGLAYLAFGWMLIEVLDQLSQAWPIPESAARISQVIYVAGFVTTVILAWFHGERGHQRLTVFEVVLLATVLGTTVAVVRVVEEPTAAETVLAEPNPSDPFQAGLVGPIPVRVVVAPPSNLSGDQQLQALGDRLGAEMRRMIGEHTVAEVISTAVTNTAWREGASNPVSLASSVNASHVIASEYAVEADQVGAMVEVLAADGRTLRALDPINVDRRDASALAGRVGGLAASAIMDLRFQDGFEFRFWSITENPIAMRLYHQGSYAFDEGRHADAVDLYKAAIEEDPEWPRPYMTLRPALNNVGRGSEFAAFDSVLVRLRPKQTRDEQLNIEWLTGRTRDDRITAAMSRVELTGGASTTYWQLAFQAIGRNRISLAAEAIELQDRSHPWLIDWPPTWRLDDLVYHIAGDYERELYRAREGRAKFPDDLRIARDEARALIALDSVAAAWAVFESFLTYPAFSGAIWDAAKEVAMEFEVHGHPSESERAFASLEDWAESQADLTALQKAEVLYHSKRYDDAVPHFEELTRELSGAARYQPLSQLIYSLRQLRPGDLRAQALEEELLAVTDTAWSNRRRWVAVALSSHPRPEPAVDELIEMFSEDIDYYTSGNAFMHVRPEFIRLRDDPRFVALMEPR